MKRVVICLALIGGSLLTVRLTFAQDDQAPVENDSNFINQVDNAIDSYKSAENQAYSNDSNEVTSEIPGNADMQDLPMNTDNNSVNSWNGSEI